MRRFFKRPSLFAQERVIVEKATPDTSVTNSETPIQGLFRAANQAARNRDYSTCAQLLEKVVATDPNYKNAWNYLGWAYNALGKYDKAETALRNAIAVNPQDPSDTTIWDKRWLIRRNMKRRSRNT